MTIVSYPTDRIFCPSGFTPTLLRNIVGKRRNPFNRRQKLIEHPGPLWEFTLIYTPHTYDDRAAVEAFWNRMMAVDMKVSMWHLIRPVPRGTLQSNTTLSGAHAAHVRSAQIVATTGLTLKAGDMLSFTLAAGGTQLVQVTGDVAAVSNVLTVSFEPALVGAANAGSVVTIVKPTAKFQVEGESISMPYVPAFGQSFSVTLLEAPEW